MKLRYLKLIYFCISIFVLSQEGIGQAPYGFEWIDFSKPHYKMSVINSRLYRIPYSNLLNVAPEIANANSSEICIFSEGVKIPVFVSWEGSNPDSSSFIEFYGNIKTGALDSRLYRDTNFNLNPYSSYFYDTNHYYLTLRNDSNLHIYSKNIDTALANSSANFCISKIVNSYRNGYETGKRSYFSATDFVFSPEYDAGEGWGNGSFASHNLATPGFINTPDFQPNVRFRLFARNNTSHRLKFLIGNNEIKDTTFSGSGVFSYQSAFNSLWLANTTVFRITQVLANNHTYSVGFVELNYPRNFTFGTAQFMSFQLMPSLGIQKFSVPSFASNNSEIILLDYTARARQTRSSANSFTFAVDTSVNEPINLYLTNASQIQPITSVKKINYNNLLSLKGDFIIISDTLLATDSSGENVLNTLQQFKSSDAGGKHQAILAYMHDIQEFFGFGHSRHPLSIRKYLQWHKNNFVSNKEGYVFLVGKGLNNIQVRTYNAANNRIHLIPPFGHAMNDLLFATYDSSNNAFYSVGRLAVTQAHQIKNYIEKLTAYYQNYNSTNHTPSEKQFLKKVIHLGGGFNDPQKNAYKANLQEFENIVRNPNVGADVFSVFKAGSDQIPTENSLDVEKRIDQGVGLVTFFGHSSATILDVGISDPNNFNNKNRYPIFLANGCSSGNVYTGAISYSEQFINGINKGAIAYLATTNAATDAGLYTYSKAYYELLGQLSYNKSIGTIAKEAALRAMNQSNNQLNFRYSTALEFVLNGDPSIPMPHFSKPDYYIDRESVAINPQTIRFDDDSFQLKIIVRNLGKATNDPVKITVTRNNNSLQKVYEHQVSPVFYEDTFLFTYPVKDGNIGFGVNRIQIKVDSENKIDEISENNNELLNTIDFNVLEEDILPVFPYNYNVEGGAAATLYSLITNNTKDKRLYFIQIDTSELFNSPMIKKHEVLTEKNGFEWKPNIEWRDSLVYYWRVAIDSLVTKKPLQWNNSSFIYLKGQTKGGWNQSHYYQHLKNEYEDCILKSNRKFEFPTQIRSFEIRTSAINNFYEQEWYLNNIRMQDFREKDRLRSGINIVWIDGKTGKIKESFDTFVNNTRWGGYGSAQFNYFDLPRKGFVFQDTGTTPVNHLYPSTPWHQVILNFLNQIPAGDMLFFYSHYRPNYSQWHPDLVNYFTNAGFKEMQNLASGSLSAPFIFVCKNKDTSFKTLEEVGINFNSKIAKKFELSGNWSEGKIKSVKIGPAKKWGSLHTRVSSLENPSTDHFKIKLFGINAQNQYTLLHQFNHDIDTSIAHISANTYPNLELQLEMLDTLNLTPAQLKYWRVIFDQDIPEVATNVDHYFHIKDTISIGEIQKFGFGIDNIANENMDTILVKITLQQGASSKIFWQKVAPILSKSKIKFDFNLTMQDYFVGKNDIRVEINPENTAYFQKEKYNFNNFAQASFYVFGDTRNPLLDVTFDKKRIANKDLVSANPEIKITLKDDNTFLLLNDTSLIQMWLKMPSGEVVPIYFAQPNVTFMPAQDGNLNLMQIVYKPTLEAGNYELIIKDKDRLGNSSSSNRNFDYRISFVVSNVMKVSSFFNYPNPFSKSTQFIFYLTGAKIPDEINIKIVNIKGQVIKEISKEELGPLKIGLNKTNYQWNGNDQFGNYLASGVYIYKVEVKDQGKKVDLMPNQELLKLIENDPEISTVLLQQSGKMIIVR
jgi:hypothetical protein